MKPASTVAQRGMRQPQLHRERAGDPQDQQHDEHLDVAEAVLLQVQDDEHVERGEEDADDDREAEQQVERDGGAEDLGEIASPRSRAPRGATARGRPGREYESRQACARSRPAAMPSRAAIACSRMAMRFEIMTTLSSV